MTMWITLPIALGAWAGLYYILRKTYPDLGPEWMCRFITLLHALIIVPCCAYVSFIAGPNPYLEPGGPNSDIQNVAVLISLSYFIFDFVWCLSSGTEGPVMLAHHVLSIFGNWITLLRNTCGTEMCATLFGAEISNPFLQIRFFLRQTNRHKTWYGELNDVAFMLVFGFMRTIVGTSFVWHYIPHPRPDWVAKSGGLTLYVMGWIWWVAILKYAYRKYTRMYREYVNKTKVVGVGHSANGYAGVSNLEDHKNMSNGSAGLMNGINGVCHKSKEE